MIGSAVCEPPSGDNSIKPGEDGMSIRAADVLPERTSLPGRALGAKKSSTLHNGPTRGEWSILISLATGEFQQCAFPRLTYFLEYNAPSCCQAFMLMLHSVKEWRISAATELDELHVRPAAAAGATGGPSRSRHCQMMARGRT